MDCIISNGETSSGIILNNNTMTVLDCGTAVSTTVDFGGSMCVFSGGKANNTTVNSMGSMTVFHGGTATDTTVFSSGGLYVSSSGMANGTTVSSGGYMRVSSGGTANTVTVKPDGVLAVSAGAIVSSVILNEGGLAQIEGTATGIIVEEDSWLSLRSGGEAINTTVNAGSIKVSTGGHATSTVINSGGDLNVYNNGQVVSTEISFAGWMKVLSGGTATNTTILKDGDMYVSSGATVTNVDVNAGGYMLIRSGATIEEVRENGGYVDILNGANVGFLSNTFSGLTLSDSATVHSMTKAVDIILEMNGLLTVFSGGTVNSITLKTLGSMCVSSGGKLTGQIMLEDGAVTSVEEGSILDFDISELAPGSVARVNDLSLVQGTPLYTLTVSDSPAIGVYSLAAGAAEFQSSITVVNTSGTDLGMLKVGDTLKIGEKDCTLNLGDSTLTLVVKTQSALPEDLVGTKDRVSWKTPEPERCVVEYSTDSFLHGIQVTTTTNAMDMLALPAGTYQWRVRIEDSDQWIDGNEILSDNIPGTAKVLQSNSDGDGDIFFTTANETWESIYYAQHVGSVNDWTGTNEMISANGRNRIKNFFFGSDDANILCLTDDANGDAVFVDDEFTELPEEIKTQQSRIARIDEIRCGAGDDIVDMTSNRIEYIGDGLTIRGGAGNDVIWANKGENKLFGDAGDDRIVGASGNDVIAGSTGNDRMHGGGGDDVFTFCENWGTDTVEQLATGSVTLWFASGDESNWNAELLTYMDGDNSVTVTGVTADRITLKFGENSPGDKEQFDLLSGMGAFLGFSSELVFEESDNGLLASLQV